MSIKLLLYWKSSSTIIILYAFGKWIFFHVYSLNSQTIKEDFLVQDVPLNGWLFLSFLLHSLFQFQFQFINQLVLRYGHHQFGKPGKTISPLAKPQRNKSLMWHVAHLVIAAISVRQLATATVWPRTINKWKANKLNAQHLTVQLTSNEGLGMQNYIKDSSRSVHKNANHLLIKCASGNAGSQACVNGNTQQKGPRPRPLSTPQLRQLARAKLLLLLLIQLLSESWAKICQKNGAWAGEGRAWQEEGQLRDAPGSWCVCADFLTACETGLS